MALTVFAEKMGFFHKGCAGIGVAPVDVCLSPPPGPVPIPYTNVLFAKDLIKGSKTVRIDGQPTFLEDYSETSTSIGDEGGTLGGSVITGVILGKGYFLVWSMTVQIEGLGVDRHGDMMGQNSASAPYSSTDAGSIAKPANVSAPEPGPVQSRRAAEAEVLDATGPGDSKPDEAKPCAMDKIAIECSHTGSGDKKRGFGPFEFTFAGKIETNLPTIKGAGQDPPIGVIAGHTDAEADTVKIEISGGPGYTCAKSHPRITILDLSDGNKEVHKSSGATSASFKAKSRVAQLDAVSRMSAMAIISHYWFPNKVVRRYRIDIEACGVNADKSPYFPGISRVLEAHPSDTYKFEMNIPDVFNRSYVRARSRPLQRGAKFTKTKEDKGWDEGMRDGSKWHGKKEAGYPASVPAEDIAGSIQLSRNGENVSEATSKLSEIVEQVQAIVDIVQGTFNYINDLVPQIGWKIDAKFAFLAGKLALEWGPKEANNHTIYPWWKLTANMTIVKAEIEASFGFSASALGAKLEAVGFVKGEGSLGFEAAVESKPDEWSVQLPTLKIGLGVEGGVRASVGADWVASGEGKVAGGFPFKAEPKVDAKDGFTLEYEWIRDDLKASVQGRVLFGGSFSREWVLWDKGTITKGVLFEPKKPQGGVPSPAGPQNGPPVSA